MPFVYSTATGSNKYVEYYPCDKNTPHAHIKRVIAEIKGGANLAPQEGVLITPKGAVTQVTDEQLKSLMECKAFLRHKAAGYMHVDEGKDRKDPDRVARDAGMNPKDGSAPITPESKDVLGTVKAVVPEPPKNRRA